MTYDEGLTLETSALESLYNGEMYLIDFVDKTKYSLFFVFMLKFQLAPVN